MIIMRQHTANKLNCYFYLSQTQGIEVFIEERYDKVGNIVVFDFFCNCYVVEYEMADINPVMIMKNVPREATQIKSFLFTI